MKLPSLFCRLALPLLTGLSQLSSSFLHAEITNMIANGGMEVWGNIPPAKEGRLEPEIQDRQLPEGFSALTEPPPGVLSGVTVSQDGLEKHDGAFSVKVENSEITDCGVVALKPIPVEPSTAYRVRLWMKGQGIEADKSRYGVVMWAHFGPKDDFYGLAQSERKVFLPDVREDSFDWRPYEFTVETSPATELLRVLLCLKAAKGTVWFDDLEISPIGKVDKVP